MKNALKIIALLLLFALNTQAQKKVTYGKTTFNLYQPISGLTPLPTCGFTPTTPGYILKNKNYGPGTFYCYAPGNVPATSYKCLFTEIRNWIAYSPTAIKDFASKKGFTPLDEKNMKKLFKNSVFPQTGLMIQLTDKSWIHFSITDQEHSITHEPFVGEITYIEKITEHTDTVLNRMYRFWNDGARFADYAGVTQVNSKTRTTAPNDPNPNNFAIGDVLNPKKGFYRLTFEGGKPGYVWHSYEKVVSENLTKPDFAAAGQLGYNDLMTAFDYFMRISKANKELYCSYTVKERFYHDLEPGRTWQQEMTTRKTSDAQSKAAMQQVQKTNAAAMEKLYKEIFR